MLGKQVCVKHMTDPCPIIGRALSTATSEELNEVFAVSDPKIKREESKIAELKARLKYAEETCKYYERQYESLSARDREFKDRFRELILMALER